MTKCFFLTLFVLAVFQAKAQQITSTDEVFLELANEVHLCKPGVTNQSKGKGVLFQYGINSGFDLEPLSINKEVVSVAKVDFLRSLRTVVRLPLLNKPGLKLLLGYEYSNQQYRFESLGKTNQALFANLDQRRLNTNKFSLYFSKSFNEKTYAIFRLRASYRGNYSGTKGFNNNYATYNAFGLLGVKPKEDLEWGLGLGYSVSFAGNNVVPFAIYNQTFNDRWGIEAILPLMINGRYNFSDNNILLFGVEFKNKNYALDLSGSNLESRSSTVNSYHFRTTSINPNISLDKKLFPWIWLNVKVGYQIPIQTEFDHAFDTSNSFRVRQTGSAFFRIGLFVSPPAKFIK